MVNSEYAQWLHAEIARAEAKADAMRQALTEYMRSQPSAHASPAGSVAEAGVRTLLASRNVPSSGRARRRSKYDPMFGAFVKAGRPLSIGEMQDIARHAGVEIDRHVLRSIVFNKKNAGEAIEQDGLYRWPGNGTETAASNLEAAVQ